MSAEFNLKAKENRPLVEYLSSNKALVADAFSASRNTIRKLLTSVGMKPTSVDTAENFAEAEAKIKAMSPKIVFAEYQMEGGKGCFDLLALHRHVCTVRGDTIFIVTSDRQTPVIINRIEEEPGIDGLIVRPFTYASLMEQVLGIAWWKAAPSEYHRAIEIGRQLLYEGNAHESILYFIKAKVSKPPVPPAPAWYYEGIARRQLGQLDDAQACFAEALRLDPRYYAPIGALFDLLVERQMNDQAQDVAVRMVRDHVIRPRRLPGLIRVAVARAQYWDILRYYDFYSSLEEVEDSWLAAMTAGLLFCAKSALTKGNRDDAIQALKKAVTACKGRLASQRELFVSILAVCSLEDVPPLLVHANDDIRAMPEVKVAEFEVIGRSNVHARVVESGLQLLKEGVRHPRVYELLIVHSIRMKRREDVIEELVLDATKAFPDRKAFFRGLLAGQS